MPRSVAVHGLSLAALVAALLLRWLLDPLMGDTLPLVTLYAAVAAAVWVGGYRPAILVGALGYLACAYAFIEPRGSLGLDRAENLVGLVAYLITCAIIIGLGESLRVAQRRAAADRDTYRVTLASMGDAVITTGPDGRVVSLNGVAESLTGWTTDEAAGQTLERVFRIVDEQTRKPAEDPSKRAQRQGVIVGFSNRTVLVGKDGTERPIDANAAPIHDDNGQVSGCVLVIHDITERRRSEERLRESEERYRTLTQAITSIVWTTDAEGRFVTPQPAWSDFTGQTWEELRDFGWANALHADDRERVRKLWEAACTSKTRYESDGRLWHAASGSYRHFEARGIPILNPDGSVKEWVGECLDVEGRKRAEKLQAASSQRLRDIFENVAVSLWEEDFTSVKTILDSLQARGITDYRSYFQEHPEVVERAMAAIRVLDVNDATVTMFEARDKRELIGSLPKIFGAESMPVFLEELCAVAEGQTYFESEAVLNTVQGNRKHVFFTMVLPGPGNRYDRVLFSVFDITARKRAQDLLKLADRRKDEFLATLAHELRNPLAPIRNAIQILLAKGPPDPVLKWCREVIDRQVQHMARLLDDLLDVSRITHNKLELRKERIELATVVQNAVETSRPVIDADGHELIVTLPANPVYLDADAVRLGQIISNLLNNAAKYSEPGGLIRLTCQRQANDLVVSVKDAGIGIAAEMVPRLFDIFSQAKRLSERSHGGSVSDYRW